MMLHKIWILTIIFCERLVKEMKRILLVSNTYYQLIMAIQMRYTIFTEDEIVLMLSDHSKGTKVICEEIKKLNVFHQVKSIGY